MEGYGITRGRRCLPANMEELRVVIWTTYVTLIKAQVLIFFRVRSKGFAVWDGRVRGEDPDMINSRPVHRSLLGTWLMANKPQSFWDTRSEIYLESTACVFVQPKPTTALVSCRGLGRMRGPAWDSEGSLHHPPGIAEEQARSCSYVCISVCMSVHGGCCHGDR